VCVHEVVQEGVVVPSLPFVAVVDYLAVVDAPLDVLPEVDALGERLLRSVPVKYPRLSCLSHNVQPFERGFEAEHLLQLLQVIRLGP